MLLYLVRHGQTDANAKRIYQGHAAHQLNDVGRAQANRLAETLRGVPIREVITSDLARAEETAKIITSKHSRASLILNPLLRDRDMGSLQGKNWLEFPEQNGAGVESDQDLEARLHAFLDTLITAHTPLSSPLSTPLPRGAIPGAGAGFGSGNGTRTPVSPHDPGNGCVMVVTHEACILALLKVLLTQDDQGQDGLNIQEFGFSKEGNEEGPGGYFPHFQPHESKPPNIDANGDQQSPQGEQSTSPNTSQPPSPFRTHSQLRSLVRTHTSSAVDVSKECGNTAVCVVRVWWEPEIVFGAGRDVRTELKAVGRVEMWGDVEHLEEDE